MNTPVFKVAECFNIQFGMTSPANIEKPKIKMLREEFMSAYFKEINKVFSFLFFPSDFSTEIFAHLQIWDTNSSYNSKHN